MNYCGVGLCYLDHFGSNAVTTVTIVRSEPEIMIKENYNEKKRLVCWAYAFYVHFSLVQWFF